MEDNELLKDEDKCKCGKPGEPWHTCPFAVDIYDDSESQCNCCPECEHECCMDI